MELQEINNSELMDFTHRSVKNEREATNTVLRCIREIEARRLFAERGYSSLFEMLVVEFKFSHGAASRRISAMRLLREIPKLESKILEGSITLTQLAQVQNFFVQEKREARDQSTEQKVQILEKLENMSSRETEKELLKHTPEPLRHRKEIAKSISSELVDMRVTVSNELAEKLERLQDRLNVSRLDELLEKLSDIALKATDPQAPRRNSSPAQDRRYVPVKVKYEVRVRDQDQCQFEDPVTKRKCQAKRYLQFDHKKPWALQGKTTTENLQLLCAHHNRLRGIQAFGNKPQLQ